MIIDARHRDTTGEIIRKHGNTLVSVLRRIYGEAFALGEPESAELGDVLARLHETSLTQLCSGPRLWPPRRKNPKGCPRLVRSADIDQSQIRVSREMASLRLRFLVGAQ